VIVDLFLVYQFIRRLATPFEKWPAYEAGVIDKNGNILKGKKQRNLKSEKDSFGIFDLMILKLKKLLAKLPGGSSNFASYAAALFLIKEWKHFTDDSMLNESVSTKQLDESLDLFFSRYNHYNTLSEDVNLNMLPEAKELPTKPPKFTKAGPDGEIEIKFPTGRKFLIRKQLDPNLRHERGSFQFLEWDGDDWEWADTVSPKAYAKEKVLGIGMWDKGHKKLVADYSSSMTKYIHTKVTDGKTTINFNESAINMRTIKLINKIKKSGVVKSGSMSKSIDTKPAMKEEPANSVGGGGIAGLDGGHMSKAAQKKWTSSNKSDKKKRLRDIIGVNT